MLECPRKLVRRIGSGYRPVAEGSLRLPDWSGSVVSLDKSLKRLEPGLQLLIFRSPFFKGLNGDHQNALQVARVDRGRCADGPDAIMAERRQNSCATGP